MEMISISVPARQMRVPTWWDRFSYDCLNLWHWFVDKEPPRFEICGICFERTNCRIGADKTKYPFFVRKNPLMCEGCYDWIFNKRIR
jgi:hypothetical protein